MTKPKCELPDVANAFLEARKNRKKRTKVVLSENQKKRVRELRTYLDEVKNVERNDFEKWWKGKKEVCVNIGASLYLIVDDE